MTNTHINVGGHKITTNKVGQIKTATVETANFTSASEIRYVVTNGICTTYFYLIPKTTSNSNVAACLDLPKPKMSLYCAVPAVGGETTARLVLISELNNKGRLGWWNTTSSNGSYFTLSYPVADDWVES